jgi:hypothetical protein
MNIPEYIVVSRDTYYDIMEAINLYEKAFNTKVDAESIDYMSDGKNIAHACCNEYSWYRGVFK